MRTRVCQNGRPVGGHNEPPAAVAEQFVLFHEVTRKNLSSARELLLLMLSDFQVFALAVVFEEKSISQSFISLKQGNHLPRGDLFGGNQTQAHPRAHIYRLNAHTRLMWFIWV